MPLADATSPAAAPYFAATEATVSPSAAVWTVKGLSSPCPGEENSITRRIKKSFIKSAFPDIFYDYSPFRRRRGIIPSKYGCRGPKGRELMP
jgi:hypothetical protein